MMTQEYKEQIITEVINLDIQQDAVNEEKIMRANELLSRIGKKPRIKDLEIFCEAIREDPILNQYFSDYSMDSAELMLFDISLYKYNNILKYLHFNEYKSAINILEQYGLKPRSDYLKQKYGTI